MTRRKFKIMAVAGVTLALAGMVASAQIDKILKGGGIAYLVTQFGPEINKAINGLTKTNDTGGQFGTKVVPVLSAGSGSYAGAVQVMGPKSAVEKVQAVVQFEGKFNPLGVRIRALVPVATKSVSDVRRIPGVGISGLLDVKL